MALVVLTSGLVLCGAAFYYALARGALLGEFRHKLLAVAESSTVALDVEAHERVRTAADADTETYRRLQQQLQLLRRANRLNRVSDLYTMRLQGQEVHFVVDSYPPGSMELDFSSAPPFPAPGPGDLFDRPTPEMLRALREGVPTAERQAAVDEWGDWLSAYAPLRDRGGRQVGIVGVDASLETVRALTWRLKLGTAEALLLGLVVSWVVGAALARRVTRPLSHLTERVQAVGEGDYEARAEIRTGDEFQQLAETFNDMARGLREREQLKGALVRHLSEQVARRIMADPEAVNLGGKKVEATVLFADVRGFTRQCEGWPPMEVIATLNQYFEVMVEAILQHQGTLDKFLGDGIMAVFGAPLPQSDHPQRALRCALGMQEAVAVLNRRRAAQGRPQLGLGIGLNSGEVVAGEVGSEQRLEYTVIGQEVNRAFRIQSVAGPGEVVLSEQTRQDLTEPVAWEDLGEVELRGFEAPVRLWRVNRD